MSFKRINQPLQGYRNAVEKLILATILCVASLCFVLSQPVGATPIGADDFRISSTGPDGNTDYGATTSDVVYNATNNEYLIVWLSNDDVLGININETEVFGKIINADTAAVVVDDFRISTMGPDGDGLFSVSLPAVTWNATDNEYAVVWQGEDDVGSLVQDEIEIFAQRIDDDGTVLLANDLRVSDMGTDGVTTFNAFSPAIVWNSQSNEYLVVWAGYDVSNGVGVVRNIFGQRLAADLSEVGTDSIISDNTGGFINAAMPAIAYNATDNEYLVVWQGRGSLHLATETEIFVQRLDGVGTVLEADDIRISTMGPDDNASYGVINPEVAWNATDNEYFVVWTGDDDTGALVNNEFEVFGQRLAANAVELGADDMRLSHMGPDANTTFVAREPDISWSSADNQYFLVWHGDDNTGALVSQEFEIYGRRLNAGGSFIEADQVRLSSMGDDGTASMDASRAAVAYNSTQNQYLIVWDGRDNTPPLAVAGELEIFAQGFASSVSNPAILRFSALQYSVEESVGSITINVNRIGDTTNAVSVDYVSSDGTAGAPADYTTASGSLSFDIGETSKDFTITVNADDVVEGDETVLLALSAPVAMSGEVNLDVAQSDVVLTIMDSVPANDAGDTDKNSSSGGGLSVLWFLVLLILKRLRLFRVHAAALSSVQY